jgi:hypothetical protein
MFQIFYLIIIFFAEAWFLNLAHRYGWRVFIGAYALLSCGISGSVVWLLEPYIFNNEFVGSYINDRLIYNCRTKMHFVGLKMQFCWTKNVRLNN